MTLQILNKIWKRGNVSDERKIGAEKEKKEEVENYKGITLMDSGYKIYAEVLRNK